MMKEAFNKILAEIQTTELMDLAVNPHMAEHRPLELRIRELCKDLSEDVQARILAEFVDSGPLQALLINEEITEIFINGAGSVWFESRGRFHAHSDCFLSEITFQNFVHRLCGDCGIVINLDRPYGEGRWGAFRVTVLQRPLTIEEFHLCLRRQRHNPWTLQALIEQSWASDDQCKYIRELISEKKNFLIVGATGSGKTSLLNACIQEVPEDERLVVIEDVNEIALDKPLSCKLLTRVDNQKILTSYMLSDLVKMSLRMRPDRLILGEVRGEEAKDLLLALATGHRGCIGTLHADDAKQALWRLEMLVQMGAPQWNLQSIRQLIHLSLDAILVVGLHDGQRRLKGIYQITSLETFGFLVEKAA